VALKDESRGACDTETSQVRIVDHNDQSIDYFSADVRWCTMVFIVHSLFCLQRKVL